MGYIDRTGKVVIELRFDFVQPFSEGLAVVMTGEMNSGSQFDADGYNRQHHACDQDKPSPPPRAAGLIVCDASIVHPSICGFIHFKHRPFTQSLINNTYARYDSVSVGLLYDQVSQMQ